MVTDYEVSGGKLNPDKAIHVLNKLGSDNDIVGLTIAEYLPFFRSFQYNHDEFIVVYICNDTIFSDMISPQCP
ncbi:hypothetical protein ACFP1F_01325 [Companilactobacillus baiquanensis]|uniref:Uncharacterized protein n=1 Tax=Companilactobacillus baiquanensis TaxID=2486005 RepID=A0ABW1UUJ5_9LACO